MNYAERLKEVAERNQSIVCVGMDPDIDKIPITGDPETVIAKFYADMLDAFEGEDCLPGAVKPNSAFYEQYGMPGLRAMKKVIEAAKAKKLPVISDCKRADIGNTSKAYANAFYKYWGFDAITVAPYMGSDSVKPFLEFSSAGKGAYILCRTSNKGAVDLQDLKVEGKPVFMQTATKILEWHQPGTGAVVGATYPEELWELAAFFQQSGKDVPLLIPGVGAQGGSMQQTIEMLKKAGYDVKLARINSSRGVNYAYQKQETDDYAGAAAKEVKKLHTEQGRL